jgi:hypothetical protein
MWHNMTEIVEGHNDPGRFTALIGYEWTSNYGGGNNLHRNVVYRDGKAKADHVRRLTTFDTDIPNELWDWMAPSAPIPRPFGTRRKDRQRQ